MTIKVSTEDDKLRKTRPKVSTGCGQSETRDVILDQLNSRLLFFSNSGEIIAQVGESGNIFNLRV